MALYDQPVTTYTDTTAHKRVITDVISIIDPSDSPLVNALGGLDGASGKFTFVNGKHTQMEWLEDTLAPLVQSDGLNGSIASTTTALTVNDGSYYQPGHIIRIGSEDMWVSAVSTNTVTVTRAFQGTAATAADASAITIVGMARLEGAESSQGNKTDVTVGSNYTQIFHKELKVTRTHEQLSQYGISSEMAYQGDKAIPELMRLIEKALFYSTASAAGSATTPRAFGGLRAFITDNKGDGGTTPTQAKIEDAVELAWNDGGNGPWIAPVTSAQYQTIKNFYDSSNFLRVDRGEGTVGMVINRIQTPFGDVDLVLDRWATGTEICLIDPKNAGLYTYHPFTQEPLAKTGDYERSEVVGEFTLCVRQDKSHALMTT